MILKKEVKEFILSKDELITMLKEKLISCEKDCKDYLGSFNFLFSYVRGYLNGFSNSYAEVYDIIVDLLVDFFKLSSNHSEVIDD